MSTARGVLDSLLIIFLIPFIVFYILKDYGEFYHIFWKLVPSKWRGTGQMLAKEIDKSLGSYIRGQLFVCLVLGEYQLFLLVYRYEISIIAWHYYWGNGYNPVLLSYFRSNPTLMIAATVSTSLLIRQGSQLRFCNLWRVTFYRLTSLVSHFVCIPLLLCLPY